MNKEQIVEIGIKKFQIRERPGAPQTVTISMLEELADEIMALHNNEDRCDKCGATCQYCNCNEPWFMKGIK